MNFNIRHKWKYCGEIETKTTPHNHFFQYIKTTDLKKNWILLISNILTTTNNHVSIKNVILQGLTSFYRSENIIETTKL